MRLNSLKLRNFRSYDHLDLDFTEPRTLIIGENGVGKSTIPDAIALVLTGRCRGVDGKGQGQKDLIRGDAAQAEIHLHLDLPNGDGLEVSRYIHRTKGAEAIPDVPAVLKELGATDAYVQASVYGGSFFEMHHADAKALLMRLLDVQVPVELTAGQVVHLSLEDVDAKYKAAYDQRTVLNRSLKNLAIPEQPTPPAWVGTGGGREDVATRLDVDIRDATSAYQAALEMTADLRSEARRLQAERDQLNTAPVNIDRQQGVLDASRDSLRKAEAELAEASGAVDEAQKQPAEPVQELAGKVNELRLFVQRIEATTPAVVKRRAKGTKTVAEQPAPGASACVLGCGIPCLTPPAEFQAALTTTRKQIEDLEAKIKAGNARSEAILLARQRAMAAEKTVKDLKATISRAEDTIASEERRREALAQVEASLKDVGPQADEAQLAVNEKKQALDTLLARKADLATYVRRLEDREAAIDRRQDVEDELKDAERLVDLLGPKGAKVKALEQALQEFTEAINANLEPFGFTLQIQVEPWQVQVVHETSAAPLRYELLSKGQKLWTGLAFQLALAAVSGLDFCVVDDAEGVVGEMRGKLTDVALDNPVGQVLIVKAQAQDEPAPDIDGLQVVRIGQPTLAAF